MMKEESDENDDDSELSKIQTKKGFEEDEGAMMSRIHHTGKALMLILC
jgi:hypothetical protein